MENQTELTLTEQLLKQVVSELNWIKLHLKKNLILDIPVEPLPKEEPKYLMVPLDEYNELIKINSVHDPIQRKLLIAGYHAKVDQYYKAGILKDRN